MVTGISYAYITGPRVVKATTGEDVSDEELGGAIAAQKKAGVVCRSEKSELECFHHIRELLSYLPSSNREKPPRVIPRINLTVSIKLFLTWYLPIHANPMT